MDFIAITALLSPLIRHHHVLQHWGLPRPAPLGCREMCHTPAPLITYTAFEKHREDFFSRKKSVSLKTKVVWALGM